MSPSCHKINLALLMILALPVLTQAAGKSGFRGLLDRLAEDNDKAFASEYFRHAFNKWSSKVNFRAFKLDSVVDSNGRSELRLSNDTLGLKVALTVAGQQNPEASEARRLLVADRSAFNVRDQLLLEFIEKFAWLYDSGDDSILLDYLYPKHIRARYQNESRPQEILKSLRQRFPDFLEINDISWTGHASRFEMKLVLDSPIQPLLIELDLVKYATARFFEQHGMEDKISILADSLTSWVSSTPAEHNDFLAPRSSIIPAYLKKYLTGMRYSVLAENSDGLVVEIMLPEWQGLLSDAVRVQLLPRQMPGGQYAVMTRLQDDNTSPHSLEKMKTRERFMVLNTPGYCDPLEQHAGPLHGSIVLHGASNRAVSISARYGYHVMLRNLSENKYVYYALDRVIEGLNDAQTISAFVVWRDKTQLWQHIAKVDESFVAGELTMVDMDLYPFIRSDNVLNLLAEPDGTTKLTKIGVKIK